MSVVDPESSTSNRPEIAETEVKFYPTESEGMDEGRLEDVPNFRLYDYQWNEELSEAEMANDGPIDAGLAEEGETVCGRDDRAKISNTTVAPWKFICKLFITMPNGGRYIGSGFFIDKRCVITSGHVVHDKRLGGWATRIEVVPGLNGTTAPFGRQVSTHFRSVNGWVDDANFDYDHGAIILPDNTLYNSVRGYFGYRQENGLPLLNNCGYPGDKTPSTEQWFNAGRATKNTGFRFEYMIDTFGGQSGSPTWIMSGNSRYVAGVHGHSGCPNKSVRCQGYVLQRWAGWRQL